MLVNEAKLSVDLQVIGEAVAYAKRRCCMNDLKGAVAVLSNAAQACSRAVVALKQTKATCVPKEKPSVNEYISQFMNLGYSILIGKCALLGRQGAHQDARALLLVLAAELCSLVGLDAAILAKPPPYELRLGEISDLRFLLIQSLTLAGLESEFSGASDAGNFFALAAEMAKDTEMASVARKAENQFRTRCEMPRIKKHEERFEHAPSPKGAKTVKKRTSETGRDKTKRIGQDEESAWTRESFRVLVKLPKNLIAHVIRQEIVAVFSGNLDLAYGMLSQNEMNERDLARALQALRIDWEALTGADDFSEVFRAFDIDSKGVIDAHDLLLFMPKHEEDEIRKLAEKYFANSIYSGPAWDPQAGLSTLLSESSGLSDAAFEELLKKFWEGQDSLMSWKEYLRGVEKQIRTDSSTFLASNLQSKLESQMKRAEQTDGSARLTKQCKKILTDLRSLMKTRLHLADLNKQLRMELEEESVFSAMRLLARENKRRDDIKIEGVPHHNLNDINDVFNRGMLDDILKKREQRKHLLEAEHERRKELKRKEKEQQLEREIIAEEGLTLSSFFSS